MGTQVTLAAKRLFDADAIGATNIKLFPGTSRDISAEQYAQAINKALSLIEAGDFDEVSDEEECA